MSRDPSSITPPGEDQLDLPEFVAWLVAACTWVRNLAFARGGPPSRARLPKARPPKTKHLFGTVAEEVL